MSNQTTQFNSEIFDTYIPHSVYKQVVLVVLDGFGVATYSSGNAIAIAKAGTLDMLVANYPTITLQASGPLVGLPWGEMGNSEVGHLNIGAGRIIGQDLPHINKAISTGTFFKNEQLLAAINQVKEHGSSLHMAGLVSNGNVHASEEHAYALLALAAEHGIHNVYLHMFTDGRDTGYKDAMGTLQRLQEKIQRIGVGKIATLTGRFYAMDRGQHWQQTADVFEAMVNGSGVQYETPEQALTANYQKAIYDEMIPPSVIIDVLEPDKRCVPVGRIQANDSLIFFNFRSDRALQLAQAFIQPELLTQQTQNKHDIPNNLYVVTLTEYKPGLTKNIAFPSTTIINNFAAYIASKGIRQVHIAETEKYAHVTSFFNGGVDVTYAGEDRLIFQSPDNSHNYEDHPEMAGADITAALLDKLNKNEHQFYVANFANSDMVAHTGNLRTAIHAVQELDVYLKTISEAVLQHGGVLIITADHGNIEQMIKPHTAEIDKDHTTNPVPCILISNEFRLPKTLNRSYISLAGLMPDGAISDIAPTLLELMGIPKPKEMSATSLLPILLQQINESAT